MKRRRRRRCGWKAPNNPTPIARAVWARIYAEPWPKGWRVEWAGFMSGALGLTIYDERRVLLSYGDARKRTGEVLRTLVHEFVHVRCGPSLRHGKEFQRLNDAAWTRLEGEG